MYLVAGGLVALFDISQVAEGCFLTAFEKSLLFVRIVLSWPTYIVEDFLLWMERDED